MAFILFYFFFCHRKAKTHLVHVSHGPSLGNIKVHRDILSPEIAPVPGRIGCHPLVDKTTVVCGVHGLPAVVPCAHTLRGIAPVAAQVVEIPGHQDGGAIALGGSDQSTM